METIKKILVATDFSDTADSALQRATQLASELGAELVVLYVLDSSPFVTGSEAALGSLSLLEVHRAAMEQRLESLARQLAAKHVRALTRLGYGVAHREIVATAEQEQVELIVMGTHGRGGFKHMLMGSVAERVARTASVPVLTVHLDPQGEVEHATHV